MRLGIVLVTLILVAPLLSGCLATAEEPLVGRLTTGSHAEYKGSDGSSLVVEVRGERTAYDAHLRPHPAIVLHYAFTPAKTGSTQVYEEAIDRRDGLLLHTVWFCDKEAGDAGKDFYCSGDRGKVFPSTSGLPGGLGVSPLWAQHDERPAEVELYPVTIGPTPGRYTTDSDMSEPRECTDYVLKGPAPSQLSIGWVPPFHVYGTPLTLCPDLPFPQRFVPSFSLPELWSDEGKPTFTLRSFTEGDEAVRFDDGLPRAWSSSPDQIPRRDWPDPPRFLSDSLPGAPVAPPEVHSFAVQEDARYRAIMRDGDDPILRSNKFFQSGERASMTLLLEPYHEWYYDWTLVAADEEGPARRVTVEVTVREMESGERSVSMSLEEATNEPWSGRPSFDRYLEPHVDPADVVPVFKNLTGMKEIRQIGHDFSWVTSSGGGVEDRPDDYVVSVFANDPEFNSGNSPVYAGVMAPFGIRVDGASGAIFTIDIPNDRLPFGPDA